MVGRTVSHYRIVRELGAGGMGVVYEAEDTRLGRRVALKFLPDRLAGDRKALERFRREARAASALNHPHICTIYDIDEADLLDGAGQATPFIAMELLEGESLRRRLAERRLAVGAIVETGSQLAEALESAHAKGIVHRDLKPENVFVTAHGSAKLLDFGIAKLASEPLAMTGAATVTRMDTGPLALGTLAYMSPEQVRGEPLDGRTDLFSLGVVLYELLTGVQPFRGTTSGAVLGEILTKAPASPVRLNPDVPPDLERIVNKLLEKDRDLRYQAARDLRVDLERLRRTLAAPPVVGPLSDQPSILVLPFENLSPDPDNAFFADGLTEEIIADLSKVHALRVISRTSAMQLRGTRKDLPTIGREMNVRYVLEGSVRRAGVQLRVTAQLIEAATDAHLWAEKYAGALDDVFEIQEKLSRTIVDALKVRLTPDEDRWLAAREVPDAHVFDAYLKARQEIYRLTPESLDRALDLVNAAIASTGPNALLYATLGQIHFHYHDIGVHSDETTLRAASDWSHRALALAPDCAPACLVKGLLAWKRGQMADAISNVRRAADVGATDALVWLAYFCFQVGRTEEARQAAERVASADPLFWFARWALAIAALAQGNFRQALVHGRGAVESANGAPITLFWLAPVLLYAGEEAEAIRTSATLAAADAGVLSDFGRVFAAMLSGDRQGVEHAFAATSFNLFARQDKECGWFLVAGFAHLGDHEAALQWLSTVIDLGFCNHHFWSELDPVLAPLRNDSRFIAMMDRARQAQRSFLT